MSYEQKYLKYKEKYISLKSKMQKGSGFPFARGGTFTLMMVITGDTLARINERRIALGLDEIQDGLHMTLLQLHINFNHLNHHIFLDPNFRQCVLRAVQDELDNPQHPLTLHSPHGNWNILGQNIAQFWARIYNVDPTALRLIRNFRRAFYTCINDRFRGQRLVHVANQRRDHGSPGQFTNYDVWRTSDGDELYAVNSEFYMGPENWLPHISVLKIQDFNPPPLPPGQPPQQPNPNNDLFALLTNPARTAQQKTDILNGRIHANTVGKKLPDVQPISNLSIRPNMRQILISVRVPGQHQTIDHHLNL
jgi:hypothetical protein